MPPLLSSPYPTRAEISATFSPFETESAALAAQYVDRSSIASIAFLTWDILITFDDEVKFIWPRTWSYTKFTYFFVRYFPLMVQCSTLVIGTELTPRFHFTPRDCFIWQIYQGVAAFIIVVIVDTILILRVYALYHNNTIVKRVVVGFYIFEIVGMAIGLVLGLPGITLDKLCLVLTVPWGLILYGAASVIFQLVLFILTTCKFVNAIRLGWGDIPIVVLLMRDGTWAFFLLMLIYAGQLGLYGLKNHAFAGMLYGWLLTAFSFAGYRILLNLNRLGAKQNSGVNRTSGNTDPSHQFTTHLLFTNPRSELTGFDSYELSDMSQSSRMTGSTRGRKLESSPDHSTKRTII